MCLPIDNPDSTVFRSDNGFPLQFNFVQHLVNQAPAVFFSLGYSCINSNLYPGRFYYRFCDCVRNLEDLLIMVLHKIHKTPV